MSYRIDDWQCESCGCITEHFTDRNGPRMIKLPCVYCGERWHRRLISAPAEYLAEKVRAYHTPRMKGGKHDTEGYMQGPPVPDLPGADEHDAKVAAALEALPVTATRGERNEVLRDASKDAPSMDDYRAHMRSPEIRERVEHRMSIERSNQQKRQRAAAIDAGKTTLAKSPLPCDSKETHR